MWPASDSHAVFHLLSAVVFALEEQEAAHVAKNGDVGDVSPPGFDFRGACN